MKVNFDPTISLGTLCSAIAIVGTIFTAYYGLRNDLNVLRTQQEDNWQLQKIIDSNQDARTTDIKAQIADSTQDLKKEIRSQRVR